MKVACIITTVLMSVEIPATTSGVGEILSSQLARERFK